MYLRAGEPNSDTFQKRFHYKSFGHLSGLVVLTSDIVALRENLHENNVTFLETTRTIAKKLFKYIISLPFLLFFKSHILNVYALFQSH